MKRFGEIFGESWREYKSNFKVFAIILLLLSVIPTMIYLVASIPIALDVQKEILQSTPSTLSSWKYLLSILFWIGVLLFSIWMYASFLYNSLYRKKEMSVKETLSGGKKYFWKFFGLIIVYGLFLVGLFLLLIIPGIIFMVFWTFAFYVLVGQNKGILDSLRESRMIVKGKWWRTFGFLLLFGLIIIGISWIFSIATGLINMAFGVPFLYNPFSLEASLEAATKITTLPASTLIITNFIKTIFNLGDIFIITPLSILFFKNFYLDMKKGGK